MHYDVTPRNFSKLNQFINMETEKLFLSVLILTKNRLEVLKGAIDSLLNQSLEKKHYEIIIMDQSTDSKSKEHIDKMDISEKANIKYIYNKIQGLHANRNIGAKKANGNVIVFVDDDIIADKDYLKCIYDSFTSDPDIALLTGKVLPRYETRDIPDWLDFFWVKDKWGRYIWEISLLDLGDEYKEIAPNLVFGCSYIVRKDIYFKYRGTLPDMFSKEFIKYTGSGETLLAYKIYEQGGKIIYNPKVIINHIVSRKRLAPEYFYYRNYIEGISNSYDDVRKTGKRLPPKQILRDFYILFKNIFKILIRFYSKPYRINFICALNRFKGKMQHKLWVLKDKRLFEFILQENYFDNGMIF